MHHPKPPSTCIEFASHALAAHCIGPAENKTPDNGRVVWSLAIQKRAAGLLGKQSARAQARLAKWSIEPLNTPQNGEHVDLVTTDCANYGHFGARVK
jgi:hypothetical protein